MHLLLLLAAASATPPERLTTLLSPSSSSFTISIDGDTSVDNKCFEAGSDGQMPSVSGAGSSAVVIWDTDTNTASTCGAGRYFIHYVGSSNSMPLPMTASAGATVHEYKAAVFTGSLPVSLTGCQSFDGTGFTDETVVKWKVARDGSSCPS